MQDDARFDWKHAIMKNTDQRIREYPGLNRSTDGRAAIWNPRNQRRSITFRTHRAFDDVNLMSIPHPSRSIQARMDRQLHFKIDNGGGNDYDGDNIKMRTATSKRAKEAWYNEERERIAQLNPRIIGKRTLRFHRSD